ncbi:preprotein translocase subunit SecE [bacterium]|nr:preprotein translocase subunit SecE [bacterium]MBU1982804.1 preprotein translocase subunit SecE [bacterium]
MFKKLINYLSLVRAEMAKVTWPTRSEMMESARIILVLSFVIAAAVFAVDRLLSLALEFIL